MNLLLAFALGALLGATAVAAAVWHLARSWRANWLREQDRALTSTTRCEELLDGNTGRQA